PETSIAGLKLVPDVDGSKLVVTVTTRGIQGGQVAVQVGGSGRVEGLAAVRGLVGKPLDVPIPNARLWSPDSPFLYDIEVSLLRDVDDRIDTVRSYFGMRKVSLGKDDKGVTRLFLNNKPLFQVGPLDQGFWPDGLYTAPTDAALKHDVEFTKRLGFNMTRKHV